MWVKIATLRVLIYHPTEASQMLLVSKCQTHTNIVTISAKLIRCLTVIFFVFRIIVPNTTEYSYRMLFHHRSLQCLADLTHLLQSHDSLSEVRHSWIILVQWKDTVVSLLYNVKMRLSSSFTMVRQGFVILVQC